MSFRGASAEDPLREVVQIARPRLATVSSAFAVAAGVAPSPAGAVPHAPTATAQASASACTTRGKIRFKT